MTRRIFLDLDGTLIDPRQRLYGLFCELAPEAGFSFDQYWQHKRSRMTQRQMLLKFLSFSEARIAAFHDTWMARVEEPERLKLDRPLPGAPAFLDRARQLGPLFLITARQFPDRLADQLRQLGWQDTFAAVLATRQQQAKAALIRSMGSGSSDDILIGDTGEDIVAGKELGMHTVAVTSGMLNEAVLREYDPGMIVASVADLFPSPTGALRAESVGQ